jgi:SNF2 family DNA or RNA helicase
MLLKRYQEQLGKTLIICKANLTVQWLMEVFEWSKIMAQRIETSKEPLHLDSFDVFIVSMDLLRDVPWAKTQVFKTVILDEVQNLKNVNAQRTKAAMEIAKKADYVWGLSGTPVKNHMAEYFPILHMVRPDLFPSESGFISEFVDHYNNGYGFQYGGARNIRTFHDRTKDFVFGYTREEVMPELPRIRRTFRFLDLEQRTNDAYRKTLVRWRDAYLTKADTAQEKFLIKGKQREEMMNLYQIVGLAKVRPTIEFMEEILDANGDKVVLFVEHIGVGDLLEQGLNKIMQARSLSPVARIRGGVSAQDSEDIAKRMRNDPLCRCLIASTRACGEGKDFSFCQQAIIVERQWNAANEEQAECRLIHPTRHDAFVDATYMVARKTMDEGHAQLVEKKREISHKAVGESVVKWDESNFMKELMELMAREV